MSRGTNAIFNNLVAGPAHPDCGGRDSGDPHLAPLELDCRDRIRVANAFVAASRWPTSALQFFVRWTDHD